MPRGVLGEMVCVLVLSLGAAIMLWGLLGHWAVAVLPVQ
jgi:hypothetical protein